VLSGQRLFANLTIEKRGEPKMAANIPPHHPYEAKIYNAVNGTLTDLQAILNKLNQQPNDGNIAPTIGMIGRLKALLKELNKGSPDQATHDDNIEGILYAIAQMGDQYNIGGHSPATQAYPRPTGGTHEDRVLILFTTIDSICREIFEILEPGATLTPQPTGGAGTTSDIVAMAKDTQKVAKKIKNHIVTMHGGISIFSK
jgi:hypothetical protein